MNNFTDFLKIKLLELLSNKRVYELPDFNTINPFVFIENDENKYIKYLNDNLGQGKFTIIQTIGHENIIIVVGNNAEGGFILLADENTNPIFLNYENFSGAIERKIILNSYNDLGIETNFPTFLSVKIDVNNFIYGVWRQNIDLQNTTISLFRLNNFINDYYLSFPVFVFKTFKLNDSFTFQEGEPPINYKFEVEKADFFKVEKTNGDNDLIDVLFWYKRTVSQQGRKFFITTIFYMCIDLNSFIIKYISSPYSGSSLPNGFDITDLFVADFTKADDAIFGFSCNFSDNVFEGSLIYQKNYNTNEKPLIIGGAKPPFGSGTFGIMKFIKIKQDANIPYIVLFSIIFDSYNSSVWNYETQLSLDYVFAKVNEVFYFKTYHQYDPMSDLVTNTSVILTKIVETNDKLVFETIKNSDYSFYYDATQTTMLNLLLLFRLFKETYSKENRQDLICAKALLIKNNKIYNASGIITIPFIMTADIKNIYLCNLDSEIKITDELVKKPNFVIALKQQNRINLLTINNSLPTITEPYNLFKTQTTYNFGGKDSMPWFGIPYNSDLGNFEIVHTQAAQIDTPTQYELIADINLIDYTTTNNNLIYSFKLNQTTMNDLVNNFWFLRAKTGQLIFKIPLSISKTIFEEKTLNFIANIILYLEDKNLNNNEFSAELFKIFNIKNDKLILENVAIFYIKIFLENGKTDTVNIIDYWIVNESIFEMSLNVSLFFKYETNRPIKYQLLSFNNIIVYEFDIVDFKLPNILEISHKFYYN